MPAHSHPARPNNAGTPPACPLCRDTAPSAVRSYEIERIRAMWRDALQIDVAAELPPDAATILWSCQSCGLGFFHPARSGSGEFYAKLQAIPWYYPKFKWEHRLALRQTRAGERVLEVGCGTGEFLGRLRDAGAEAEGVELNESAVSEALARGLPVRLATLEELIREGRRYDAVMAFQVLEHVPEPREFLEQCAALLRPGAGARLVLGVPHADGYHRHVLDPFDLPPHHMTRWSRRAFRSAAGLLHLRLDRLAASPLDAEHAFPWASAVVGRAKGRLIDVTEPAGLAARVLSRAVRTSGLMSWLPGHTIYASLSRPGA